MKYLKATECEFSRRMLKSKLIIESILRIFITNSIEIKCNKIISDDISEAIENVAKKTKAEIHSIETDRKNYCYHVDCDILVKNLATPFLIALLVSLRDSIKLIGAFCDIGVTCSYALQKNSKMGLPGWKSEIDSLLQGVNDKSSNLFTKEKLSMALFVTLSDK